MNLEKKNNIYEFSDYASFFKFIDKYDGELTVRKYEVFDNNNNLIAIYKYKNE